MKSSALIVAAAVSLAAAPQTMRTNPKTPKAIQSTEAPPAKGPYSQGVEVHGSRMVFLSGQTARDPKTGDLVTGDIACPLKACDAAAVAALLLPAGGRVLQVVLKVAII